MTCCSRTAYSPSRMSDRRTEDDIRKVLTGEHAGLSRFRSTAPARPVGARAASSASPRSAVPAARPQAPRIRPLPRQIPAICSNCIRQFRKPGLTGAEIPVSLLFADVRGSTGHRRAAEPDRVPRRSSATSTRSGRRRSSATTAWSTSSSATRSSACSSAACPGRITPRRRSPPDADLIERVGRDDATPSGPIPLGAGIHTGIAYVGPTGPAGAVDDFTALGDVVNTTARLASAAAAGELLVSVDAATEAGATDDRCWSAGRSTCAGARRRSTSSSCAQTSQLTPRRAFAVPSSAPEATQIVVICWHRRGTIMRPRHSDVHGSGRPARPMLRSNESPPTPDSDNPGRITPRSTAALVAVTALSPSHMRG